MTFFQPLFKALKRKGVLPEMVAGLDMIVEDIRQRNYLHAYDIYMRLAIGAFSHRAPAQQPVSCTRPAASSDVWQRWGDSDCLWSEVRGQKELDAVFSCRNRSASALPHGRTCDQLAWGWK